MKVRLLLVLGCVLLIAISFHWLGAAWTLNVLWAGFFTAAVFYLADRFGVGFGQLRKAVEQGLQMSYGRKSAESTIARVRRSDGVLPYASAFVSLLLFTFLGLLSMAVHSTVIAFFILLVFFFIATAALGVFRAFRPIQPTPNVSSWLTPLSEENDESS